MRHSMKARNASRTVLHGNDSAIIPSAVSKSRASGDDLAEAAEIRGASEKGAHGQRVVIELH